MKFATDADYALLSDDLGPICNPDTSTGLIDLSSAITGDTITYTVGDLEPGDRVVGHFVVKVD